MNDNVHNFDLVTYWVGVWRDVLSGEQSAVGYPREEDIGYAVEFFKEEQLGWELVRVAKVEV